MFMSGYPTSVSEREDDGKMQNVDSETGSGNRLQISVADGYRRKESLAPVYRTRDHDVGVGTGWSGAR